jgi:prepilin-type N-terminal cleavage/methylation domain-containing protein
VAGFSLVEMLVAIVLLGLVGGILTRTLVGGQRLHAAHAQEVAMSETTRAALAILPGELRELSAGDGDIIRMDSASVAYKSMGSLYVLCGPPDTAALTVPLEPMPGSGPVDAPGDSVLLFSEGDPATRADDAWLSGSAVRADSGTECPAGRPGLAVTLAGLSGSQLLGLQVGAPVRTFRAAQLLAYPDAARDWWLGQRLYQPASGSWSTVQPVLGPLAAAGLSLVYRDSAGQPASAAHHVTRIRIRVRSRSPVRVRRAASPAYVVRDGTTQVVLRNNPHY